MYKANKFPGLYPNWELFTGKEMTRTNRELLSKLSEIVIAKDHDGKISSINKHTNSHAIPCPFSHDKNSYIFCEFSTY